MLRCRGLLTDSHVRALRPVGKECICTAELLRQKGRSRCEGIYDDQLVLSAAFRLNLRGGFSSIITPQLLITSPHLSSCLFDDR